VTVYPAAFVLLGAAFAAIGLLIRGGNRRFAASAARATATVVDVRSRAAGPRRSRGLIWVPVVRFETADGRTVETETDSGTNLEQHEPGQAVEVLYDPANPTDVRTPGPAGTMIPTAFMVIGACFIAMGLAFVALLIAVSGT
jgi:hypothetical protein